MKERGCARQSKIDDTTWVQRTATESLEKGLLRLSTNPIATLTEIYNFPDSGATLMCERRDQRRCLHATKRFVSCRVVMQTMPLPAVGQFSGLLVSLRCRFRSKYLELSLFYDDGVSFIAEGPRLDCKSTSFSSFTARPSKPPTGQLGTKLGEIERSK